MKYFVSFHANNRFGNAVISTNYKIKNMEDIEVAEEWINQKCNAKNSIVLYYKEIKED